MSDKPADQDPQKILAEGKRDLEIAQQALAQAEAGLAATDQTISALRQNRTTTEQQISTLQQNLEAAQEVKRQLAKSKQQHRGPEVAALIKQIQQSVRAAQRRSKDLGKEITNAETGRQEFTRLISEYRAAITSLESNLAVIQDHISA